jgi:hypothetical protein
MSLVRNEQAKLTATYVNGLAIAVFAVGGLAPLFSVLYSDRPAPIPFWSLIGISLVCFAASGGLHYAARRFLKGMRE